MQHADAGRQGRLDDRGARAQTVTLDIRQTAAKAVYLAARTFWISDLNSSTSAALIVCSCFSITGFSLSRIRARSSGETSVIVMPWVFKVSAALASIVRDTSRWYGLASFAASIR